MDSYLGKNFVEKHRGILLFSADFRQSGELRLAHHFAEQSLGLAQQAELGEKRHVSRCFLLLQMRCDCKNKIQIGDFLGDVHFFQVQFLPRFH